MGDAKETAVGQERIDPDPGQHPGQHRGQIPGLNPGLNPDHPPGHHPGHHPGHPTPNADATSDPTAPVTADSIEAIAVTELPAEVATEAHQKLPREADQQGQGRGQDQGQGQGQEEQGSGRVPVASVAIPRLPEDMAIASGPQFRQDTRYEVDGDAEVFVKTGSMGTTLLRGRILDLSATGCFIQTMARVMIKPGTVVQLVFSIYGTNFRIDAASRYARMRLGVGFRFLAMDEPTHKRLHEVLGDMRSKQIHENQPVIDRAIL